MRNRKEQRLSAILPVRLIGIDKDGQVHSEVAHTLDISIRGARIGGLKNGFSAGQFVIVLRKTLKCQYTVSWSKLTNAGWEVGLRSLEPKKNIWDVPFDKPVPDVSHAPGIHVTSKPVEQQRRTYERYSCDVGVELITNEGTSRTWARCKDICVGGCYIETRTPLPIGSTMLIGFVEAPGSPIVAGTVRTVDPVLGMGIELTTSRKEDRDAFESYVQIIASRASLTSAAGDTAPSTNLLSQIEATLASKGYSPSESQALRLCTSLLRSALDGEKLSVPIRRAAEQFTLYLPPQPPTAQRMDSTAILQ